MLWVNPLSKLTDGEVVAIDGKTLCGSASQGRTGFHLVSSPLKNLPIPIGRQIWGMGVQKKGDVM